MEIILKEDLPKLGRKGDIVKVADGYGRNYLLPQRLAIAATAGNMRNIEQMRSAATRKEARDREAALAFAAQLAQVELTFARRAGDRDALFGSVTSMDIMHALAERGHEIERRKIDLPDPIKTLGESKVPVHLFAGVTAELRVRVEREATEADEAVEAKS